MENSYCFIYDLLWSNIDAKDSRRVSLVKLSDRVFEKDKKLPSGTMAPEGNRSIAPPSSFAFQLRFLKNSKSRIDLPTLVFPRRLVGHVVDIAQSDLIARSSHHGPEVELRAGNNRKIAFPECVARIVDEMLVLVYKDPKLRAGQQAQDGHRPVAQEHRHRQPVKLASYIVDTVRYDGGEIVACPVIGLVEIQFGLQSPAPGYIDLREGACRISELELLAERFAIDFEQIGASLNSQMEALRVRRRCGGNCQQER